MALNRLRVTGGQQSIRGCVGPLTQSVDDLVRFQMAILDQEPWETETSLVPLSWRREIRVKTDTLTVGILVDDG